MHNGDVDIEFDPAKARANLRKHRVSFADAEQALRDPFAVTIDDPDAEDEQRFVTLGWTPWDEYWSLSTLPGAIECVSSQQGRPAKAKWSNTMRKEYDFSKGRRGAVVSSKGKTRITIMLDDDILEHFRARAEAEGMGYQTMINAALREAATGTKGKVAGEKPLTAAALRKILREELHAA